MIKIRNIVLIAISIVLYTINQKIKFGFENEYLRYFMTGYFNDILAGTTFMALCNTIFGYFMHEEKRLIYIEMFIFACGLFWEYTAPLIRSDSVSDVMDIIAYMLGGFLYWSIMRVCDYFFCRN